MSIALPPSKPSPERSPTARSPEGFAHQRGGSGLGRPVDAVLTACGSGLAFCVERLGRGPAFAFAAAATLAFYLPSLVRGSTKAGYLYVGDVVGFYWPMITKLRWLLSRHHFTALDVSQYNGSADFFLAPNFFACHPFFVLWSLFVPRSAAPNEEAFRVLVLALAAHGFLACYFSLRLLTRFFQFDFWTAGFAALAFAFSVPMIHSHAGFPMFVFCAATLPWAAYAALDFEERPAAVRLVLAAVPVVMTFLGGYVPLGAACLGVAAFLVALKLLAGGEAAPPLASRGRRFCTALLPFALGTLVVAPYLVAVYFFVKASPAGHRGSLFFSAHELAEWPQTVLRLLSFRYPVPGPQAEFSLTWGLVAVGVIALFLSCRRAMEGLRPDEWTLVKACGGLYAVIALAIFGQHSVVSDLLYYFVPQVGQMHIYQRLLLPAQLLFGIMLALMLKSVATVKPAPGLRLALAAFGGLTVAAAFLTARNQPLADWFGLNNYLVYELMLATLCMAALLVPGRTFAMAATAALFTLPALDQMYDYSQGNWSLEEKRPIHGVALDPGARQAAVDYLRRFDDRAIVKYADVTPRWLKTGGETFPKVFPLFVLDESRLSSYMGFNYYLSTRADYMESMPYLADTRLHPDWDRIRRSGVDFVVGLESDVEWLRSLGADGDAGDIHRLPHGAVIVPLRTPGTDGAVFDNGYVRVFQGEDPRRQPVPGDNLARGKPARQSSDGGGEAARAVDGNVDGRFAGGSVTHTAAEPGAWLEVDLGAVEPVRSVRVWNRAEAGERLHDFWVLISEQPFPSDAPPAAGSAVPGVYRRRISSQPRPNVTVETPGARGRYVRIQLATTAPSPESILSLAEVEVFRPAAAAASEAAGPAFTVHDFEANDANYLRLDLEAATPVTVQYLLWNNPKLRFSLNGAPVEVREREGLATITLPPGRHALEARYRHRMLMVFWGVYGLFGLAVAWSLLAESVARFRNAPGRPFA